jgi:hypothetical protein
MKGIGDEFDIDAWQTGAHEKPLIPAIFGR